METFKPSLSILKTSPKLAQLEPEIANLEPNSVNHVRNSEFSLLSKQAKRDLSDLYVVLSAYTEDVAGERWQKGGVTAPSPLYLRGDFFFNH